MLLSRCPRSSWLRRAASSQTGRLLSTAVPAAPHAKYSDAPPSSVATDYRYRLRGHEIADIDPLGLAPPRGDAGRGLTDDPVLKASYCGPIGLEIGHVESQVERAWFFERMEEGFGAHAEAGAAATDSYGNMVATLTAKRRAHLMMTKAAVWEEFVGKRFTTLKRYSGEGAESMHVALDEVFSSAAWSGVSDVVVGMPHRGRLAFLVSALQYPARKLFRKLRGQADIPSAVQGLDDVSSHVAASYDAQYGTGSVHISLLHNPSHLEAVNPVAMGKTRAKLVKAGSARAEASQSSNGSSGSSGSGSAAKPSAATATSPALCVLVHGDGAVSGQGVVWESLAMSQLAGYSVGGTVHVVVNNQVAFTADASTGRSTSYCTDIAKGIGAPILHVNSSDIEAVLWAARTAVEYRQAFGRDIMIDLVTYRKHGHNELDQPSFTQPQMYERVGAMPSPAAAYAQQLMDQGVLTSERESALRASLEEHLAGELAAADEELESRQGSLGTVQADESDDAECRTACSDGESTLRVADSCAFAGKWSDMRLAAPFEVPGGQAGQPTGYDAARLLEIAERSVGVTEDVAVHPTLLRNHVDARIASVREAEEDQDAPVLSWATAEAMAFGSLLDEGFDVRLAGQDSLRGTFSHRHAGFVCQKSQRVAIPPAFESGGPRGRFEAVSSHLSEEACLGFEIGHSMETPNQLNIWEAQFGDFANSAQIMIDQFLSGTESKWLRQSGLVLLLPHGFDGAGPEHSSARIERFLQLVNTPAWANQAGGNLELLQPDSDGYSGVDAARDGFGVWALPSRVADEARAATPDSVRAGDADKSWLESANISVCQPSTPASYFHLLRRQLHRPFRKPLVVVAPKTLLRLKAARSPLREMAAGTSFQPVLADPVAPKDCHTVLLCSGRSYYDLRNAVGADNAAVAVVRLEELAPFPGHALEQELTKHGDVHRVAWVQEEPLGAGAWSFVAAHAAPIVTSTTGAKHLDVIARPPSATPAVGVGSLHKAQSQRFFDAVQKYCA